MKKSINNQQRKREKSMEERREEHLIERDIEKEMRTAYID